MKTCDTAPRVPEDPADALYQKEIANVRGWHQKIHKLAVGWFSEKQTRRRCPGAVIGAGTFFVP